MRTALRRAVATGLSALLVLAPVVTLVPAASAITPAPATVRGVVLAADDPTFSVDGAVLLLRADGSSSERTFLMAPAPGQPSQFRFDDVPSGEYRLLVNASDGGFIVRETEVFAVAPGGDEQVDIVVERGGTIAGAASVDALPTAAVTARAVHQVTGQSYESTAVGGLDGQYEIRALPPGEYRVQFSSVTTEGIPEWWEDVAHEAQATSIPISGAQRVDGVHAVLQRTGTLSGTVVDAEGDPIIGAFVTLWAVTPSGQPIASDSTDASGRFTVTGLVSADVLIQFTGPGNHIEQWWGDAPSRHSASPVTVSAGVDAELGVARLATGGRIVGRVTSGPGGVSAASAVVEAVREGQPPSFVTSLAIADEHGDYAIEGLAAGRYAIRAHVPSSLWSPGLGPEWYPGVSWRQEAELLSIEVEQTTSGIDLEIDQRRDSTGEVRVATERIAGPDRYAAAAAMSSRFPRGVDVAYVATGRNFPDALGAAAAAAHLGSPLLLVEPTSVPDVIRAELRRLEPSRIVLVGGTSSVSTVVENELAQLAGAGGVRRDAGADRFEASRVIAERAFVGSHPKVVLIATGRTFPDALAGASWAGRYGAPVLLVDGTANGLDAATVQTLRALGVDSAVVAGGPASVSPGVVEGLASLFSEDRVRRISAPDRYGVARALSADAHHAGGSDTVFLATGLGFPDALAGAALAGGATAPLVLVPGTCVPVSVLAEIERLEATRVVILGGERTVSPAVEQLTSCGW